MELIHTSNLNAISGGINITLNNIYSADQLKDMHDDASLEGKLGGTVMGTAIGGLYYLGAASFTAMNPLLAGSTAVVIGGISYQYYYQKFFDGYEMWPWNQ
jgi:hypothetical protein